MKWVGSTSISSYKDVKQTSLEIGTYAQLKMMRLDKNNVCIFGF